MKNRYCPNLKILGIVAVLIISFFLFIGLFQIMINVLNADLYGRLNKTIKHEIPVSKIENEKYCPTVTLILHKHIVEDNSIEVSIVFNYERNKYFQTLNANYLEFEILLNDGYGYFPSGLNYGVVFFDSINRNTYGYTYSGFESERFSIPSAPSLSGYPFDNIQIRPQLQLFVNGEKCSLNFEVQKRISGRLIAFSAEDKDVIILTRTPTEKYFVLISSMIFMLLMLLLTYNLIVYKNRLNTIEELIAVAGFVIASAGFRDLIGFNRQNGTSALEVFVILIPIMSFFLGAIYLLIRGKIAPHNRCK